MSPREQAARNQRIAADPLASAFVTANAGSGKTKVLVDRIARLLLAGSQPSSFLCITYTKAAANEMQRRLFERLGGWCVARDAELSKDLAELVGEDGPAPSAADLAKARALFAAALETPGGLKIQTIHAFCERLLARFPIEAGVAPGFDIADDARARAILERARADVVLNADADAHAAFERFATRLPGDALEGLLDRLAGDRAAFAAFGGDAAAIEAVRKRHGALMGAEDFARAALARAPWDALARARAALSQSTANDQKTAARIWEAEAARDSGDARAAFDAFCAIALKKDGEAYKTPVTKKLAASQPWLETLLMEIGAAAEDAGDSLNAIERAEDGVALVILAARLSGAYERAKAANGVLDFEDLIAHAQALLSRADAAPWVLYKLDGGLDHILIDEGQDTSPAQWNLLAPLQEEFFAGRGAREKVRTVFAVGDPKQSIYGFQGADPQRFLNETQALSSRADRVGRKFVGPVLETSFRSTPEILSAVDATFERLNLAPGAVEGQNVPRHLANREAEAGLVEVWPITPRPERESGAPWDTPLDVETGLSAASVLAQKLASVVRDWIDGGEGVWEAGALRPMHAGDVLVLVRKRGPLFRELIRAFKRKGLPVAGADRMVLRDELAVEDCLALIRVALDPGDDFSLACVLKGPWCDLDDDDEDLFPLCHGRTGTLMAQLLASTEEKYAAAREFVAALCARSGAHAFDFLSWALETRFEDGRSGWERVLSRLGPEARDPIEELLARALKPSAQAAPSLHRFVFEIESDAGQVKREMEAPGENVRVMTVHGAKGLEARVVILPDTTGPVDARVDEGVAIDDTGPYLLGAKSGDDSASRAARERYSERALGEHWRLLYVAMTRARDRLIVCGAQHGNSKTGEAEESWRRVVEDALGPVPQACATPFGEGLRIGAARTASGAGADKTVAAAAPAWARALVQDARVLAHAAPSRLKREDPALFSPRGEGQARFRRGRLIHGLLQRLPDIAPERRAAAAQAWLKRQGAQAEEAQAFAAEALRVVDEPRFAALFGPGSRAEVPIVGEAGGRAVRGVVDRLAVDGDGVLLLDFKTDRPAPPSAREAPGPYVLQMALYQAVIGKIFPQQRVRCALLWTEIPNLVELEEAQLAAQLHAFAQG